MRWLIVLGLAHLVGGQEAFQVLIENIGTEPISLDEVTLGSGDLKRVAIVAPGQRGKLNSVKGQEYRLSAAHSSNVAKVTTSNHGHVRCWVSNNKVNAYGIWDSDVFKNAIVAEPDHRIMRQEKMEVMFKNLGEQDVSVRLLTASGHRRDAKVLRASKGKKLRAYWGQVFELSSGPDPANNVLVKVEGAGVVKCTVRQNQLDVRSTWQPVETAGFQQTWLAHAAKSRELCEASLVNYSADGVHFCDGKYDARIHIWHEYVKSNAGPSVERWNKVRAAETSRRLRTLSSQPARFQKFTTLGHKVLDVPSNILKPLQQFWRTRRLNESEPEPQGSETVAGSDAWMLYVEDDFLDLIHKQMLPVVAQWAGVDVDQLVPTDAYGMRLYRHGSYLNMHVDSGLRAALSVIIQVGHLEFQDDFKHDVELASWPLHIVDHDGTTHVIPSRVGQMILYESATCPHGRPSAFSGRELANVFLHYNPIGWPTEYESEHVRNSVSGAEL